MIVNLKSNNSLYDRTDILTRYYKDIRKYKILTQEEENNLFLIYQDKNSTKQQKQEAKDAIIHANLRFALSMAKHFATNDNLSDLINEAIIGMMIALEDFNVEKNVKFIHYAVHTMRRQINHYCMKHNSIVKKNNISKTYHTIAKATNDFYQKEERKPTVEELAEILEKDYDVVIKDYDDLIDNQYIAIDYDDSEDEGKNIGDMNIFNSYTSSSNFCENYEEQEYNKMIVNSLLTKLLDREQKAITLSFGIGCREHSNDEIAKILGVSKERVRQIILEAQNKMLALHKKSGF